MNLNHLKYFFDAIRLGKISESAQVNLVSQSAVSQAILSLEQVFNCPLLVHQRKRIELTDAGRAAYEECQKVFSSLDSLRETLSKSQTEYSGDLSLASNNSLSLSLLSTAISGLQEEHPHLRFKLKLGNSLTIREWLHRHEVELALTVDPIEEERLQSQLVCSGKYVLFHGAKTRANIKNGIYVTRRERPEVQSLLLNYKKQFKKEMAVRMEIVSWEVIKSLVLAGTGIGLCPEYVIQKELKSGQAKIFATPWWAHSYKVTWIYRKKVPLSKNAELLIKSVKPTSSRGFV